MMMSSPAQSNSIIDSTMAKSKFSGRLRDSFKKSFRKYKKKRTPGISRTKLNEENNDKYSSVYKTSDVESSIDREKFRILSTSKHETSAQWTTIDRRASTSQLANSRILDVFVRNETVSW